VVENLGFLASPDPVALDAASFSLLRERWEAKANQQDLPGFTSNLDFLRVLQVAELLGMGRASFSVRELS
jgi:uncharacterized Fe-S center protein